jgi:hypothetical protein
MRCLDAQAQYALRVFEGTCCNLRSIKGEKQVPAAQFACRPLLERREVEGNFLEANNRLLKLYQQSCRTCTFLKEFLYREKPGQTVASLQKGLSVVARHTCTSGKT